MNGGKAKVKKKSLLKEKSKASSELLSDLFVHPERDACRKSPTENETPM